MSRAQLKHAILHARDEFEVMQLIVEHDHKIGYHEAMALFAAR